MHTLNSIKDDLIKLGVRYGDTIFLRVSYRSIGKIEGGPKTFIDAIMELVGEEGTVLLTAFPTRYNNKLKLFHIHNVVDSNKRPHSNTGVMSNIAMTYPGAFLSYRVDFPFVAIGKHAKYLTENHSYDKNGYWILEEAIYKYDCKCLRIGGEPFIGTTHMSLSHVLKEKGEYQMSPRYGLFVRDSNGITWRENNNVIFCPTALKNYLPEIMDDIKINEGKVGEGYAIITNMKKSMELEQSILRNDISKILCDKPDCWICRKSFSFSTTNQIKFFINKCKYLHNDGTISFKSKIRILLEMYLLTTKNQ